MEQTTPIKIGLISLGCAKNLVDSEVMLGTLLREGMTLTQDANEADVLIVNTCGFIEASKKESIDAILRANQYRTTGRCKALIMAGCLTQRYPQELRAELPEVDAIVGLNEVPQIGAIVEEIFRRKGILAPTGSRQECRSHEDQGSHEEKQTASRSHEDQLPTLHWSGPAKYVPDFGTPRYRLTPRHWAYVKIAEGCNHPCTFCSIPRIRGKHRSRAVGDVLAEVRALVAEGVREINLISQDTTFFGIDLGEGRALLCELLREIEKINGDFWVRLLYTHPAHWSEELIATMAACGKVCRYVDIPLQHINDAVLERMRRETDGRYIRELIGRIRAGIPGIALRTTFIVGFPGETEAQFEELLEFMREARFERLGVFAYSQEDHTGAGNLAEQLPAKVKQARYRQAMALQQRVSRSVQETFVGRSLRVLVEEQTAEGWRGRSHADAPEIDGSVQGEGSLPVGEFATVRITGAAEYDLFAAVGKPMA